MTTTHELEESEAKAIEEYAVTTLKSGDALTELMRAWEPSVTAWRSEGDKGLSLDACRNRIIRAMTAHVDTLHGNSAEGQALTAVLDTCAHSDVGRVVKNIDRRNVIAPFFKEVGVDIDLCTFDFLGLWGSMSKAAIAADVDIKDMIVDHVVPNASSKGKLKGQFTRQTYNKVLEALKPAKPEASGDDDTSGDDTPGDDDTSGDGGTPVDVVEIPQGGLIDVWHDFESKVFPQKDTMTDEEREYLLEGMTGLLETLTIS